MARDKTTPEDIDDSLMRLTKDIVAAYVGNNEISASDIPGLVRSVHSTLSTLKSEPSTPIEEKPKPAVSVENSITPDYLICLEDGKELKMLKRYLRTHFDMSPEDYRKKWSLPLDYPMVAPNYAAKRSAYAKKIGLGQSADKRGGKSAEDTAA